MWLRCSEGTIMKESFSEWKEKLSVYAEKVWPGKGKKIISEIDNKKLMSYYDKNYTISQVIYEDMINYDKS